MTRYLAISLFVVMAAACAKSGMGKGVRTDIQTQMQSVQDPIAACYETALQKDRKLRGRIEISFVASPDTGKFHKVEVLNDEVGDDELSACVVDQVSTLKLESPQKTAVNATYPLDFEPSN